MSVMQYRWKWIIGSVTVVAVSVALFGYFRFNEALRGDYYTVDVIQMIQEYVETNNGKWPSAWEDLKETDRFAQRGLSISDYQQYAFVDFSLTSDQLIQKPELIYEAVAPIRIEYVVYPHARDDLQHVVETMRRQHSREP